MLLRTSCRFGAAGIPHEFRARMKRQSGATGNESGSVGVHVHGGNPFPVAPVRREEVPPSRAAVGGTSLDRPHPHGGG